MCWTLSPRHCSPAPRRSLSSVNCQLRLLALQKQCLTIHPSRSHASCLPILKPAVGVSSFPHSPPRPCVSRHGTQRSELPGSFEMSPLDSERLELRDHPRLLQGFLPGSSTVPDNRSLGLHASCSVVRDVWRLQVTISTWVCRGWDRAGKLPPSPAFQHLLSPAWLSPRCGKTRLPRCSVQRHSLLAGAPQPAPQAGVSAEPFAKHGACPWGVLFTCW